MGRMLRAFSTLVAVAATAPRDAAAHSAITVHTGSGQPAQIAFFGDDLLVGSPLPGNVQQIDVETGTVVRTFTEPVPAVGSYFGAAVATVGGNIAIGAPGNDGAVYLFDGANGMLLQTFANPSPGLSGLFADEFGRTLGDVNGDVLVGAQGEEVGMDLDAGTAYLFDSGTGAIIHTFLSPNPTPFLFGSAVAGAGGDAIIGALFEDRAYLFDGTTGGLLQTFVPPMGDTLCGAPVAALGSEVLVACIGAGKVHVHDAGTGSVVRTFTDPGGPAGVFGAGLAVSGGRVLIGDLGNGDGAAYLYDGATATLLRTVRIPTPEFNDQFGAPVALAGDTLAVVDIADQSAGPPAGAVYAFCGGATPCAACETCGPAGSCVPGPNPTCRVPTQPRKSTLIMVDDPTDPADRVTWKWKADVRSQIGDFGRPLDDSDQTLCVFDATNLPVFSAQAPADDLCDGQPCWKSTPSAIKYRDPERTPDGVKIARLLASETRDVEKVVFRGQGPLLSGRPLGFPVLPLTAPLQAQVQATDGWCWGATYSAPDVNTSTRLRAQSD